MKRPTVGLACIMKNEAHNLSVLLQSVRGCVDQIVIVDTGSTDESVSFLEKINQHIEDGNPSWSGLPKIQIEHFEWVDDFSQAREYSFSFLKTDYGFWLDCDDELSSAAAFIHWRDNVMHSAHFWLATYNYSFNEKGNVECQFVRERVVKLNYGFKWKYFVHEGLVKDDGGAFWPQKVSSWWVNHRRSEEDKKGDYLRNIAILNKYKDRGELPSRMKFYHGKELVENGFPKEGCEPLLEALKDPALDIHDRVLAIQYAAQSALQCKAYDQAIELLMNGIKLVPSRAEYWCSLGDIYAINNNLENAIQSYKVALNCVPNNMNGIVVIYGYAYDSYPKQKLAEILTMIGKFDEAKYFAESLAVHDKNASEQLLAHINGMIDLATIRVGLPKTDDVIITCPPQAAVTDWDEHTLKEKGHGGSETAAIEVAKWIKKKTNRNVKIFQPRAKRDLMESGVEYLPSSELNGYLKNIEPHAHIMWRHSTKLTNANSYVWCHDLQLPGGNLAENYDKVVALSEFHKHYLKEVSLVPEEKIVLGFNGINPDDFWSESVAKDPLKVIFSSSPDRGLVQSIDIVKRAREKTGLDIKLHCFYGTANMRKMGATDWAEAIEAKIKENDFVVYHGMVNKTELMKHFKSAAVWLYPADFIETYCITAIEALCAGVWPIVRSMGALPYTLKEAIDKGMCDMTDVEAKGEEAIGHWASLLTAAIENKKYEKVDVSLESYSWERVAEFFIKEMNL